jgi:hypothetical protein
VVPDADLQLRVVIKALRDVVAPAVDTANRPAIEQLQLSIATLGLLKARLPLLHQCARRELANAIWLAEAVGTVAVAAETVDAALTQARAALKAADLGSVDLEACKTRLLEAVCSEIERCRADAVDREMARAVIAASKGQFDLARAWCLPAGFELHPGEVPPLEDLLRGEEPDGNR